MKQFILVSALSLALFPLTMYIFGYIRGFIAGVKPKPRKLANVRTINPITEVQWIQPDKSRVGQWRP